MATFTQMKDEMKTCPYNPLHKVSARRLQAHIVKCSRNTSNPVLVDCPFNALHKVLPDQLQQHILICKDSRQVIREIEESRNRPQSKTVINRSEVPISSDDWDKEIDTDAKNYVVPGLLRDETDNTNPEESNSFQLKTNIQIQCMKPSDRKKYYKELAEKAKSKDLPQMKSELRIKEEKEKEEKSTQNEVEDEDHPNNVRIPNTIPFKRIGGIGRGNTPISNRTAVRQIGSNHSLADSGIKRERDANPYPTPKRFSPDLTK